MSLDIVVARARNGVIGRGSEIPWRVKGEQKLFKDITMGGILIMGRKTFEAIGRPLPGRETVIVTGNRNYQQPGCTIVHSVEAAIDLADGSGRPGYVVGGGEIYRQVMDKIDGVHISTLEADVEGDIYFPEFPDDKFTLVDETHYTSNIDYLYQYYKRTRL
jgi:dihydrofolate reductase